MMKGKVIGLGHSLKEHLEGLYITDISKLSSEKDTHTQFCLLYRKHSSTEHMLGYKQSVTKISKTKITSCFHSTVQ